jgi:cardiolipin synthase
LSLNLPNLLTIGRLLLVPFVIRNLWTCNFRLALTLVFVAGGTDAVDGYLARHFNWTTRLGAYLDPIADKLLLVSVYVMLAVDRAVPVWLVWLVLGRDVLILAMVAWGWWVAGIRSFPPSVWGKISTSLQILTALVVMSTRAFPAQIPEGTLQSGLVLLTAAAAVWSGLNYGWRGMEILRTLR